MTSTTANPVRVHRRGSAVRRWLVVAVVLGLGLLALDRIAAAVTAHALAGKIQKSQGLSARPHVGIAGFPFLTQAIRGRYDHVHLRTGAPISRDGVRVTSANVDLYGVEVSASDVLHGSVRNVPVDHGTGEALISYADLNTVLARYTGAVGAVTVSGAGPGRARLSGPFGLALDVRASVVGGHVRLAPDPTELQALPAPLRTIVSAAVATPIALPPLPFGVTLTAGQLEPAGLVLHAVSRHSLLPIR